MATGWARPPVWWWTRRQTLAEEHAWRATQLGAAGWLVSVALRGPAGALVSSRMPKQAASTLALSALISGPAEELIRLLLVLVGVQGFASLLWAGFGWGTVEVVSTLVTAVGVRRLLLDPSDKAAEARRGMVSMGWLQYVQSLVPVLGAVERAAVSVLQIGFTLLLGWNWWLVLVTMPAHSALNLRAVQLIKRRSVLLMETIVVVVGAAAFALGLLAWHR